MKNAIEVNLLRFMLYSGRKNICFRVICDINQSLVFIKYICECLLYSKRVNMKVISSLLIFRLEVLSMSGKLY